MKKIIITDDMWNAVDDYLGGGVGNYPSFQEIFQIPLNNDAEKEKANILCEAEEKTANMNPASKNYSNYVDTVCRKLYRLKYKYNEEIKKPRTIGA